MERITIEKRIGNLKRKNQLLLQEKEKLEKVDLRKLKQQVLVLKSDLEELASKNEIEIRNKKNENKKYLEMLFAGYDSYYELEEVLEENKFKILIKIKNQILNRENIFETAKVGEEFNPEFHEALNMHEISKETKEIKVKNIMRQGYKQEEKILRIAKVIVE